MLYWYDTARYTYPRKQTHAQILRQTDSHNITCMSACMLLCLFVCVSVLCVCAILPAKTVPEVTYSVGWDVKPCSLTHSLTHSLCVCEIPLPHVNRAGFRSN